MNRFIALVNSEAGKPNKTHRSYFLEQGISPFREAMKDLIRIHDASTAWLAKREYPPSERISSLLTLTRVQIRAIADDITGKRSGNSRPTPPGAVEPSRPFSNLFSPT